MKSNLLTRKSASGVDLEASLGQLPSGNFEKDRQQWDFY
jgi:hypothetical protein